MLNRYYEDELARLKDLAVEFAAANPALAPMLSGRSTDPDVERLLEGVAFLTGMARQKLSDEFPEFIQELAALLFPHYLRPLPATSLVVFERRGALTETVNVRAGIELASVPVDGTACTFRTTQSVDVHPLALTSRLLESSGGPPTVQLDFSLQGVDLSRWSTSSVRLFLSQGYADASKLLMLLSTEVATVRVRATVADSPSIELGASALQATGFDADLIPYPAHAFPGFRQLQEFFVQPEKFLFVDIVGIDRLPRSRATGFSVSIELKRIPSWLGELDDDLFALHIVPVINLFSHHADPISLDHRQSEYRVLAEGSNKRHYQVHSIDRVTSYRQGDARQREYRAFGVLGRADDRMTFDAVRTSARLDAVESDDSLVYRTSLRPGSVAQDPEIYLSFAYPRNATPQAETLSIELTCTNRYLPESLRYGDIRVATSTSPERLSFRNIRPMTPAVNPPLGESLRWRILGHTALNFFSLADAANLRSLLSLYVFSERQEQGNEAANRRRIAGIKGLVVTQETRMFGRRILRGQHIRMQCQLDHFAGIGDMFVFGSVIDRFLGAYAAINTFTRFELEDIFSGEIFKWTPRLGQQTLL